MRSFMLLASILFSITSFATDLTSTQKQFIKWDHLCCYSQEVIDSVQPPIYNYQPHNFNLDLPPLREPASKLSWSVLIGLQVLDVYTTERALHYSCVKEVNPMLGQSPDVQDIIALKVLLFGPSLWYTNKYQTITNEDLAGVNYLMTAVVANNVNVWHKAKTRRDCIKIR